ncbi:hypothetical protein [Xanthomonas phage vB_XooS_NR08]|nr:hypothetical protein [Xanthomonas phage vB_XooS_NR08]
MDTANNTAQKTIKPDWNDAPEWANFLARNGDGKWFWHEAQPAQYFWDEINPDLIHNEWRSTGRSIPADSGWQHWALSVESKPQG